MAASLAACTGGGNNKTATTRATLAIDVAAARYLALANEANDAAERFNKVAAGLLTKTVAQAQVVAEASAFAKALDDMNKGLAANGWPPKVAPLVRDLMAANTKVIADMQRAGTVAPADLAAWNHDVAADEGRFTEIATKIRVELRLPPAEA